VPLQPNKDVWVRGAVCHYALISAGPQGVLTPMYMEVIDSMIETAVCGPNTTTPIFKLAICSDMSSFERLMRLGNAPYSQNRLSRITGAAGLEQDLPINSLAGEIGLSCWKLWEDRTLCSLLLLDLELGHVKEWRPACRHAGSTRTAGTIDL
jgi:hypothetical protein